MINYFHFINVNNFLEDGDRDVLQKPFNKDRKYQTLNNCDL